MEVLGSIPSTPTMNKKALFGIIIFILLGGVGFLAYQYAASNLAQENIPSQNTSENGQPSNSQAPQENESADDFGAQVEYIGEPGGLTICSDKCGDGICQVESEKKCANLNCVCQEDKQECPQDCK